MFKSLLLLYKGQFLPIGRKAYRKTLTKGRSQKSPKILLPPFISVHELRLMLNLNYTSCFRMCKVSVSRNKYTWSDNYGRTYQAFNKRDVIVPYETAAFASKLSNFQPVKVDPEPKLPQNITDKNAIPVVAVLGHKNHGKTTLIEKLLDREIVDEPLKTTQSVKVYTMKDENKLMTLIDTPGDELFDVIRGRVICISDLALVIISSQGGELQTRDVIIQADKFKVPIIFCINIMDKNYCNINIMKTELKYQCNLLYTSGVLSRTFENEIDNLISINILKGVDIYKLKDKLFNVINNIELPINNIEYNNLYGGDDIKLYDSFIRRSNCLITSYTSPICIGFILEIEKLESFGIILTIIIKFGRIIEGNYFIAGTAYGKITGIYDTSLPLNINNKLLHATTGMAVKITGLKDLNKTSIDDLIIILPQHDAFRIAQYRQEITNLKSLQINGPEFHTPWAISLQVSCDTCIIL